MVVFLFFLFFSCTVKQSHPSDSLEPAYIARVHAELQAQEDAMDKALNQELARKSEWLKKKKDLALKKVQEALRKYQEKIKAKKEHKSNTPKQERYYSYFRYQDSDPNQETAIETKRKKLLDAYHILGLSFGASEKAVMQSYRKLALKFHPDKNKDPKAKEKFQKISTAYAEITKEMESIWHKPSNPAHTQDEKSASSDAQPLMIEHHPV